MLVIANILQPLIDLNEAILKFFHDTVGVGWGLSIIGLTIVIRLAILPLTYKQVRSMQEMQRFSPEMKRIRDRYKDDKQRQNEELMKLYKEHGFNPLGSCLPLVLQLPFFFGLYQTLRSDSFIADVHASGGGKFLFIPDVTEPLKGHTAALVVMIILYVGSQLGSSYVSSLNVQDKNQRRLLFIFPFVFVPVVINFEAGLLVYWITTNLFTISQQLVIRKFMPPPAPHGGPVEDKKGAKGGGADGDGGDRTSRKRPSPKGGGDGAVAADGGKPAKAPKAAKASSASNGQGNGGPRKAPPRSPRKKKKRTGRRR
jgi:YidC/Oxa1 family membrane protein insertase